MSAARIKKGDTVVVLAGKDKGRTGTVSQVMPKDDKVLVEGVNVHARHRKPDQANPQGGIERKAGAAAHLQCRDCRRTARPTRVRFEERDGKKVRVAVKTGEVI